MTQRSWAHDSATQQYGTILAMITDGRLPPGSVLLETELTGRLGVSRTPVREALARLDQQGLIVRDVRGYRVKTRTPEEILEIFDARVLLESDCAAAAALRASPYERAALEHLTAEAEGPLSYTDRVRLNDRWHAALRAAAHNATVQRLLDELRVLQRIYDPHMRTEDDASLRRGQEDHARIVDAVRRGDDAAARAAMTGHLSAVRDVRVAGFLEFLRHQEEDGPRSGRHGPPL